MKLGTKIQLYTTVMIAIVVVLTNLLIYFAYKHYSLEAEMGQLENRGNNIITEIQEAEESGISGETVLQYFSLSDGYITMLNEQEEHIVRIATEESYLELVKPYSTSQYRIQHRLTARTLSWRPCRLFGKMVKFTVCKYMRMYIFYMIHTIY